MRIVLLAPLALLTACGSSDGDAIPDGVTAGEAKAVDEASAMIEQRRQKTPATTASATGEEKKQ